MTTFVTGRCPEAESHPKDYIFDSAQVIGFNKQRSTVNLRCTCEPCSHEWSREAAKPRVKSLRYPHYNDSLGEVVDSRGHEEHLATEGGFSHI